VFISSHFLILFVVIFLIFLFQTFILCLYSGLYECPDPYKRLLSPELLRWAAGTGRFVFHKDTCCQSHEIREKIRAVKSVPDSPFRFYNANIATLAMSCEEGGDGFRCVRVSFRSINVSLNYVLICFFKSVFVIYCYFDPFLVYLLLLELLRISIRSF
jgi:hypothetical protein